MAALVQSYPQQSGTVTMLQTRSSSGAGMLPVSQPQANHQFSASQPQRNGYHGVPNGVGNVGYRTSSTPIQPYAFTTTPSLNSSAQRQQFSNYRTSSSPSVPTMQGFEGTYNLYRHHAHEEAKRFRRRSMPTLDSADYPGLLTPQDLRQPEESSRPEQLAPSKSADKDHIKTARIVAISGGGTSAMHSRNGSSESVVSSRSSSSRPSSSANRNTNVSIPTGNPAQLATAADQNTAQDYPKLVNIPPRSSSSDAAKRLVNPSPLSKPVTMDSDLDVAGKAPANGASTPTPPGSTTASSGSIDSPAVKQLAAINQKGGKLKSKTSRLRRAFSFGSAAELRKAGVTHDDGEGASGNAGPSKLRKEPTPEELYDAEQARIAQQQEEAGIGNSIYAGAKIFSGSTDNLSISSTASSASIMIRKMGRGMKKGGRSLVGLFRPKSIVGVPPMDSQPADVSQAAVTMVTVEAERERVNVNADPHSQNGGGTGFPRLERNSIDASRAPSSVSERLGSSGTDNSASRKSIVGGEKERAEVLAAVRKGILKHSSTASSPSVELPSVPPITDSPSSSAPSTPNDEAQGHRRTGSVAIGSEDYFVSALRLRQDSKSSPGTPQGMSRRNATFSPRIVFYDTWPSQEYDRRGDIATCNRLTPMLAQQIKEELNSFKMEMEVHENSKIYTQFF
ncbi:Protein BNI4 [Pleurostoma richardsiae]|uniref:Protein BNI4 n=1 Tax=Pleurostoma richardsiae TaxID=41990 RepID=A0AA38S2E1_9PEZI|nr:Protein BNI4 [Pleurostoma richardsiae]